VRLLVFIEKKVPYHNYIYNRLPEEEPLGSEHVEDIKITKLKY